MTRWLAHVALLAVLLGAWFLRAEVAPRRALLGASPYAAFDDAESSYRLRAVELTLAAGGAPRVDGFLAAGDPAPTPFPPLVHAALATVATQTLDLDASARELGGVDEGQLERFALGVSPLLGLLAVGLAFGLCAWIAPGPRRIWAGVAAAAVLAFMPTAIAGEAAGMLRAQPWIEIFSLAEVAALAAALRAREQVDVTLGALLAGFFSGLSLLAGVEAWPLSVGALAVLFALVARAPRPKKRDAWRAAWLFLAVTCAVIVLADPGRVFEFALPRFAGGIHLRTAAARVAALPCVWWLLFLRRDDPLRAVLLAAGFLAWACAWFDERFAASSDVVLAASVALLVAEPPRASNPRWNFVLVLAPTSVLLASVIVPWIVAPRVDGALRSEFVAGLRWLRTNTSSPGPFNSADAWQDWRVWTAPDLAGSVAYHGRRPLITSTVAGVSAGPKIDATAGDFLEQLDAQGALFVVATPCMLADLDLIPRGATEAPAALASFVLDDLDAPVGWQRVHATATRVGRCGRALADGERGGPLLSIWRRESSVSGASSAPTMR